MFTGLQGISIDDEKINLMLVEELAVKVGLNIKSFIDPVGAIDFIKNNNIDIAFVDYLMPQMNGIEVVKNIRKFHPDIPIIMITSMGGDEQLKLSAIEAGATEFLLKPLRGSEFIARITNLSNLRKYQLLLKNKALLLEDEVKDATQNLKNREFETLIVLGNVAEYKDPETGNHVSRVAHYSRMLAMLLNESEENQENLFNASPLHDVGKIGIRDSILNKPGKLTQDEWEIMKTHSTIGYEILKSTESPFLKSGAVIAKMHHEKFDGTGYPNGLRGSQIHLFGRIVAVADVFDALMTRRPYKEPWPFEKAIELLFEEKGKHFDPDIVDLFLNNLNRVKKISNIFKDI
ncbi:MAG: HD domain-containing phosphohydrolase [Spirochaetota bacterium]